jgi:hypothetical protein
MGRQEMGEEGGSGEQVQSQDAITTNRPAPETAAVAATALMTPTMTTTPTATTMEAVAATAAVPPAPAPAALPVSVLCKRHTYRRCSDRPARCWDSGEWPALRKRKKKKRRVRPAAAGPAGAADDVR